MTFSSFSLRNRSYVFSASDLPASACAMERSASSRPPSASATIASAAMSWARTCVSSIVARRAPFPTLAPSATGREVTLPITWGATAAMLFARTVPTASPNLSRGADPAVTSSTPVTSGLLAGAGPSSPFSPHPGIPTTIPASRTIPMPRAANFPAGRPIRPVRRRFPVIVFSPFLRRLPVRAAPRTKPSPKHTPTSPVPSGVFPPSSSSPLSLGAFRFGQRPGQKRPGSILGLCPGLLQIVLRPDQVCPRPVLRRLRVQQVDHPRELVLISRPDEPRPFLRRGDRRPGDLHAAGGLLEQEVGLGHLEDREILRAPVMLPRLSPFRGCFRHLGLAAQPVEQVPRETYADLPGAVVGGEDPLLSVDLVGTRCPYGGKIVRFPEGHVGFRVGEPQGKCAEIEAVGADRGDPLLERAGLRQGGDRSGGVHPRPPLLPDRKPQGRPRQGEAAFRRHLPALRGGEKHLGPQHVGGKAHAGLFHHLRDAVMLPGVGEPLLRHPNNLLRRQYAEVGRENLEDRLFLLARYVEPGRTRLAARHFIAEIRPGSQYRLLESARREVVVDRGSLVEVAHVGEIGRQQPLLVQFDRERLRRYIRAHEPFLEGKLRQVVTPRGLPFLPGGGPLVSGRRQAGIVAQSLRHRPGEIDRVGPGRDGRTEGGPCNNENGCMKKACQR